MIQHFGDSSLSSACSVGQLDFWLVIQVEWYTYAPQPLLVDVKRANLLDMARFWASDVMYHCCALCLVLLRMETHLLLRAVDAGAVLLLIVIRCV